MQNEFDVLNIDDLDVQELENRLEMSVTEAAEAGWISTGGGGPTCLPPGANPPHSGCPGEPN